MNILRSKYFSGENIFSGMNILQGEYFSGLMFFRCEYFLGEKNLRFIQLKQRRLIQATATGSDMPSALGLVYNVNRVLTLL